MTILEALQQGAAAGVFMMTAGVVIAIPCFVIMFAVSYFSD